MSQAILQVENLNKTFKGSLTEKARQVLKGVSFQVLQGKTTGFVGVNGSGKTTSLKCILGFLKPDFQKSTRIEFFGKPAEHELFKSRIGYLPERPYLYEFLTAEEFLHFHWKLASQGDGFKKKCEEVLHRVNLAGIQGKRLRQFSKGMMQRIGFAQALIGSPEFLILDEPMSGLDPDGRFLIKEIIKQESKRGTTILFSSHYLGDIEELSENLIIIDQGSIIYHGSTVELINRYVPQYRVTWKTQPSGARLEEKIEIQSLPSSIKEHSQRQDQLIHISPDFVALEAAFHHLRGKKDSGS